MSKDFAIVKIRSKQHQVSVGDKLDLNRLHAKEGDVISFDDVLLLKKGKKLEVGNPTVKDSKIEAKVLKHFKGKKIKIFKYKAKSRYRRRIGHRQLKTQIEITKI